MRYQVAVAVCASSVFGVGSVSAQLSLEPLAETAPQFAFQAGNVSPGHRLLDIGSRGSVGMGELYTARLLGQTTSAAAFLNGGPTLPPNYAFDGMASGGGVHVVTQAPISVTEGIFAGANPNEFDVIVQLMSDDSSDLLPTGINAGGLPVTQLRFDVGRLGSGSPNDPITYLSSDSHAYLYGIDLVLFRDGAAIFQAPLVVFPTGFPTSVDLSSVWVVNGAAGAGVDAIQTVFHIRDVPTPGVLAIGAPIGLIALRRRR